MIRPGWVKNCIIFFVIMYGVLTMATLLYAPHMVEKFKMYPVLFLIPVVNLLVIANVPREIPPKRFFWRFFLLVRIVF